MSKGRRRRERVVAQGGPKTPTPPKPKRKQEGFPWPEWLKMPVAAAFGLAVVITAYFPIVGFALVPVAFIAAFVKWPKFMTIAMAVAYAAGVMLLLALAPTDLGPVLGIVALGLLGIVSGHYLSTKVLKPIMDRRQGS
jgi:hypothetical protein